ncbi:hypothetical protein TWF569_002750 [Orbilia oligospora]|uniref:DUF4396 domain-containing protein n=1 Tax=Orbilia oligospora TaxID=2813651 RepID=A0A7C8JSK4_ORBOL|nr:hypothetical protein TWF703_002760 [Orbilia oligospora]KAF3149304.1 hypothetical protein TWF594_011349 [Orbilia oligospora]KAF3152933.1 hypothetical protein TWF569_002750 [Orbilia oligospora]
MLALRANLHRSYLSPTRYLTPTGNVSRGIWNVKSTLILQKIRWKCSGTSDTKSTCSRTATTTTSSTATAAGNTTTSSSSVGFWSSRQTWNRAMVNTFRCLVGCTAGDFSAMWYLQAFHPEIGIGSIMAVSMASGLSTSLLLETVLLKYGRDKLPWPAAAKTAAGMSIISMLTMEMVQNMVDYHLTGGSVQFESPMFWMAAVVSMSAGFLAPLPYNYHRLRKYGKGCH